MKTLLGFIKKEFWQILRDPRMRILLFLAPCVQLTIFGVALSTEANNIRLSLVGAPNDSSLQELHRKALASGWFVPAKPSLSDPYEQIQKGQADAVLIAPTGGLDRALGRKEGEVQLLINATNVTRAQGIERYMGSILRSLHPQDPPLQFDVRVLYNPAMRSALFLVPGVMSMLVCLITILLTSMSVAKEKELGTFETLISAPVSPEEVILGKTVPFVLLGLSNIPLIVGVAVVLFGMPMRGSLWMLLLAAVAFVCCTVGIGLFISTVAKNQQQSMMGGFLYLFPSVLLSGMVFPVENMPWALRIFSYINPLTYFIELLRNIMLKGGDLRLIAVNVLILVAMAVLAITASWRRFKTTLS
ncbi:putative multidrug ABC transporter permease YbhR [Bdellovibrio bacteriovorus]|uniref:ABC transporter permease n=1 Tax=Bdellovibrio bacteriovorus TaxID=959 RepID=UPI00045BE7CC|nr:ABC transporter permease [Bdellovibrio bacteriovorus]AHZ84383.1 multidrug ABC transporter permease [Bdellovibrio bacteriovorus]BEV68271.1 putative multidrug ABC transporter permease YbhR [Bdellovibrio bacteriovorus]